jgi:uncharacterized OsmC-like protein
MSQAELKAALEQMIAKVRAEPAAGRMTFSADTTWKRDMLCEARVRDHPPMLVDEPAALGGTDAAMNPVELLLVALGTCQEITYSAFAAIGGIPLDSVKVRVSGELDIRGMLGLGDHVPAGYGSITFDTEIESPAGEAAVRELAAMVATHCPVLDTLTRAIPAESTVRLNGRALGPSARTA